MKKATSQPRLLRFFGSDLFFRIIIGSFLLQALWIVFTARYPGAFDEDFHLGIIRLYAHHLSPFWSQSPAHSEAYGAVIRDPSYLYHYLLSFVYRFISLFTSNQATQVMILRLLNVGFFAASLPLFRRLLRASGASRAIVNVCLAVFVLIPIVPFLAAQINYDNLVMPTLALSLLMTQGILKQLATSKTFDTKRLLQLLALCLFVSLVKYAFLPIFFALVLVILYRFIRAFPRPHLLTAGFRKSIRVVPRKTLYILLAIIVVLSGLFFEREGLNLVHYHEFVPDCSDVLSVNECLEYGPWNRDYYLAKNKPATAPRSVRAFSDEWAHGMWLRSFFALDGAASEFQTRGPFEAPAQGTIAFLLVGSGLFVLYSRRIFRRYDRSAMQLFITVPAIYIAFLWFDEYRFFLHTGAPVAINGRYLLPILLPLILLTAFGYRELFRRWPRLGSYVALAILGCLLYGGGALTYILRSQDSWYWNSSAVRTTNHAVQRVLGPNISGYENPGQFIK
jgi:hypothetical protein